jgi:hypothetical protein
MNDRVSETSIRQAAVYVLGIPISRFGWSAWHHIRATRRGKTTSWELRTRRAQEESVRIAKERFVQPA